MNLFFKVGIALILGFLAGKLVGRLKLPNVTGYVIAGLCIGVSLQLIFADGFLNKDDLEALTFISELALCFIAFNIGSEFTVKSFKELGKNVFLMTTFEVLFAVVFVVTCVYFIPFKGVDFDEIAKKIMEDYGVTGLTGQNVKLAFALVISSLAAATAPAATILVMRQYKAYGPVTQTVLGITALDDIYGICIFGIFMTVAKMLTKTVSQTRHIALQITQPLLEIAGSVAIGFALGFALLFLAKRYDKINDDLLSISLASILLSYGICKICSKQAGMSFSPLLANITVGSTISNFKKNPHRLFDSLNNFVAPLYTLFFVLAGASLNLGYLGKVGAIGAIFIIARGVGKFIGSFVGGKIAKAPDAVTKWTGFALLPQGGVTIGLLVIIHEELPFFHEGMITIAMVSVLIYEIFGPVFSAMTIKKSGEVNGMETYLQKTIGVD